MYGVRDAEHGHREHRLAPDGHRHALVRVRVRARARARVRVRVRGQGWV